MENSTLLDGALHLANLGYHVFPAQAVPKPDGTINKPPQRGVMWSRDSTRDVAVIKAWWQRWPDAKVAIDCGKSGIVVLDVDPRHGGAWDDDLAPRYGTVSGGEHVLYREPRSPIGNDNTGKVASGVDVKGLGGYVVCWRPFEVMAPPSGLGELPAAVVQALKVPAAKVTQSEPTGSEPVTQGENVSPMSHAETDPFGVPERAFTVEQAAEYVQKYGLDPLRHAVSGSRNDQLNKSATVCGHFANTFWSVDSMKERLTQIALEIGLDKKEIGPTIQQGLRKGMSEPYVLAVKGDEKATSVDSVDALIAEMLDTDQLDGIPELEPLIQDFLMLDSMAQIVGKSGKGKSFVSIDMACHVGTGLAWHGHDVAKGEVVYLVAEGARGIKKRVRAWEQHYGRKATGVRFLPRPIQAEDPEWLTLIEACRRIGPEMVIIDTQARVTVGIEENSAKEMGSFVHRAEALRAATGACVVLIHHAGHQGEEGRGSTAVKGALQTQLSVTKTDRIVTVSTAKQKDDTEAEPIIFSLVDILDSAVLLAKGESVHTDSGDRFVGVPDPEDTFKGYVKDLIGVFLNVFSEGTGGTRPEVRAHFGELQSIRDLATSAKRRAFDRAWARLEQMGRLARTEGTQRYRFITVDELTGTDD